MQREQMKGGVINKLSKEQKLHPSNMTKQNICKCCRLESNEDTFYQVY